MATNRHDRLKDIAAVCKFYGFGLSEAKAMTLSEWLAFREYLTEYVEAKNNANRSRPTTQGESHTYRNPNPRAHVGT